jgi:hypothetical protein
MPEVISCPSCQRKLQVPEALEGQDVQCPTCGTTFTAHTAGTPPPLPTSSLQAEEADYDLQPAPGGDARPSRRRYEDDYDEAEDFRWRRRRGLAPHRGGTVLTLGIVSLVCLCVCNLLSLILGPIAWSMGQRDLAEMRAGRMDPDGEGITRAGWICGIIGTILGVVVIAAAVLILMLPQLVPHR